MFSLFFKKKNSGRGGRGGSKRELGGERGKNLNEKTKSQININNLKKKKKFCFFGFGFDSNKNYTLR